MMAASPKPEQPALASSVNLVSLEGLLCRPHGRVIHAVSLKLASCKHKDGEEFCRTADLIAQFEAILASANSHVVPPDDASVDGQASETEPKPELPDEPEHCEELSPADEISRTFAIFVRSGLTEIRIIGGNKGTWSGYFTTAEAAIAALKKLDKRTLEHASVYFLPNPPVPALLARAANRFELKPKSTTSDTDIVQRDWLLIDLDPVRPANVSSTEEEHAAALARAAEIREFLGELGFPAPVIGDSGNGAHLNYRIDLANGPAEASFVKRLLEALAFRFSDNVVGVDLTPFNAARIWKLYGTVARKGDDVPDRPHRRARLIGVPAEIEIIPQEALERLAALAPAEDPRRGQKQGKESFDIEEFIARNGIEIARSGPWQGGQRYILRNCPWNSEHEQNQGAFILSFPSGAIAAGCRHDRCSGRDWRALRDLYEPDRGSGTFHSDMVVASPYAAPAGHQAPRKMPTAASFLAEHRKRISKPQIVEGLLPAGSFNMLVGRPFDGKSSTAAVLAVKVYQGGTFAGRRCAKSKVAYFALERSGAGVAELFERWGVADEISYEGEIPVDDAVAHIERRIREEHLEFIIVDHLQHAAHIAQGNDYANVSNALAPFQRIAAETGCCILVLHHQKKPQSTDLPADQQSGQIEALGSAAYVAASETLIESTRWRDAFFLRAMTRGLTDIPRTQVIIDFDTGEMTTADPRDEEMTAATATLTAYLTKHPGETEKTIRAEVHGKGCTARVLSEALRNEERFRHEGKGGRIDPFRWFLAEPAKADSVPESPRPPIYTSKQSQKNDDLFLRPVGVDSVPNRVEEKATLDDSVSVVSVVPVENTTPVCSSLFANAKTESNPRNQSIFSKHVTLF